MSVTQLRLHHWVFHIYTVFFWISEYLLIVHVNRNQVVVAFKLDPMTREIKERNICVIRSGGKLLDDSNHFIQRVRLSLGAGRRRSKAAASGTSPRTALLIYNRLGPHLGRADL